MKKLALFAAILVCTTLAATLSTTTASAQVTYQNNVLNVQSISVQKLDAKQVYVESSPTGSIGEITGATAKILQLKPVQWGSNGSSIFVPLAGAVDNWPNKGFRVSDLEWVLPSAVGTVGSGFSAQKRINYNVFIPYLVGAIKEQNARIVSLEQRLAALENR